MGAATLEQLKKLSTYQEEYQLSSQFRMQANDEVINWINAFKRKQVLPLPHDENYEFKVFETMKAMHEKIKNQNHQFGLSRVVSTFDYLHKKMVAHIM